MLLIVWDSDLSRSSKSVLEYNAGGKYFDAGGHLYARATYCCPTVCFLYPLTSTWPHLRCDVGQEEGEYWKQNCLCSSVYYYNGALWLLFCALEILLLTYLQRYKQVGQMYRALILLDLAPCLPSASVFGLHGAVYMYILKIFSYILFTF